MKEVRKTHAIMDQKLLDLTHTHKTSGKAENILTKIFMLLADI